MKKLVFVLGVVASMMLLSCGNYQASSDQKLSAQQEQLMNEANAQIGMPAIKNFQERKLMKMILELRDQENLICYAYIVPELTGKPMFIGKCIGYGLPYATQYTNPEKVIVSPYRHEEDKMDWYAGTQPSTIPQADPNGLFMPSSAEGTWVMLIDPTTNEPHPVYIEPRVIISPFDLYSKPSDTTKTK